MTEIKNLFAKPDIQKLLTYTGLTVLIAFVYNISLKEHFFSRDIYIAITLCVCLAFIVGANYNKLKDRFLKLKRYEQIFCGLCLVIIPLVVIIRNGDLANGNFGKPFFTVYAMALLVLFTYLKNCRRPIVSLMLVFTLEHTLFTWVCYFFPTFYKKYIFGLFPEFTSELGWQFDHRQIAGLTMHYSTNALYLAIGLILMFAIIMRSDKRKFFYIPAALTFGALLLTGKRGTLVFAVAAIITVYIICNLKDLKKTLIRVGIALIIAVLVLLVLSIFIPTITQSFTRFFGQKDITNGRLPMYSLALDGFKRSPVFGVGFGEYKYMYERSSIVGSQDRMDTHNIYLQLLCETGIVGFVFFVALMGYILFITYKMLRKDNKDPMLLFAFGIQVFILTYGLTGNPIYDVQALYPYIIGLSVVFQKKMAVESK